MKCNRCLSTVLEMRMIYREVKVYLIDNGVATLKKHSYISPVFMKPTIEKNTEEASYITCTRCDNVMEIPECLRKYNFASS